MQKLTAKEATEKALCKICVRRFRCDFNEFEKPQKHGGCMLRNLIVKEWMNDMMGFER
jgi:hypothetical protein